MEEKARKFFDDNYCASGVYVPPVAKDFSIIVMAKFAEKVLKEYKQSIEDKTEPTKGSIA